MPKDAGPPPRRYESQRVLKINTLCLQCLKIERWSLVVTNLDIPELARDSQSVSHRVSSISVCLFPLFLFPSARTGSPTIGTPIDVLSINMKNVLLLQLIGILSLCLLCAQAGEISKRKVLTSLEDAGFCRSYKFAGEKI